MVGVPMHETVIFSCSDPKLSDAQTRNFEAIKYSLVGKPPKGDFEATLVTL